MHAVQQSHPTPWGSLSEARTFLQGNPITTHPVILEFHSHLLILLHLHSFSHSIFAERTFTMDAGFKIGIELKLLLRPTRRSKNNFKDVKEFAQFIVAIAMLPVFLPHECTTTLMVSTRGQTPRLSGLSRTTLPLNQMKMTSVSESMSSKPIDVSLTTTRSSGASISHP